MKKLLKNLKRILYSVCKHLFIERKKVIMDNGSEFTNPPAIVTYFFVVSVIFIGFSTIIYGIVLIIQENGFWNFIEMIAIFLMLTLIWGGAFENFIKHNIHSKTVK